MEGISSGNIYFYNYTLKNFMYFTGPDYSQSCYAASRTGLILSSGNPKIEVFIATKGNAVITGTKILNHTVTHTHK
jgi:hypothetical protein